VKEILYHLENVGVCYRHFSILRQHRDGEIWALKDLSLDIFRGETIGIIGRNGVGKTTTLRLFANIISHDAGVFECYPKRITMLSIGAGFDNYLTGRENIGLNGRLLGLTKKRIGEVIESIIQLSELEEFIDLPVRTYSSGMRTRLGFAIAYYADPEVLLLDENLGVGDEAFQKKSTALIKEKLASVNQTAIIVSHSIPLIKEICSRVIWLENGRVQMVGIPDEITRAYQEYVRSSCPKIANTRVNLTK
jgi:lipopolysaccharide transport system ATP-binding protein